FDTHGHFRADLAVEDLDVPEGVRMVVGARLRRLGEDGPRVLASAAVLGRVFSFELLQHLEEIPEHRLLDIVEEAERARLIFSVETSAFEEAVGHLTQAAERADAATTVERAQLLDLRGNAERSAGHWPEAIATWHQAVDAYEALGDPEAVGRVCLDAAYSLNW